MYRVWVKDKEGAYPDYTGYVFGEPDPITHDQEIAEFEHLADAEKFRQNMAWKHPGAVYVIHELWLWAFPFKSQDTDECFPKGDIHPLGYGVVSEVSVGGKNYRQMCSLSDSFKSSEEGKNVDWDHVRGGKCTEFVVFGGLTDAQTYASYLEKNQSSPAGPYYGVYGVKLSVREVDDKELTFKEAEHVQQI